jgi:serine/threonine-protein kinase
MGHGAMGFVISARHLELGEHVALKFLLPQVLATPEIVARFAHEARASVRIKSEHVARVFDVGSLDDGTPFIVMEHLEGEDLASVLAREGSLPLSRAIEYVMQACEGLAAAHSLGTVHRDVKPENLFLVQRPNQIASIKVLDFGISKISLTGSPSPMGVPLVQTMMPVGSPMYMSPEQLRGLDDVDERTDIWSLGCVLYELLAGQLPFEAQSITQLTAAILEQEPASLERIVPDLPPEVAAIVARCLQKNPTDRYQSVAELAVELYPFAPRRARLYAERSISMLRVKAPGALELHSAPASSPAPEVFDVLDEAPRSRRATNSALQIPVRALGTTQPELAFLPDEPARAANRWLPIACVAFGVLAFASGFVLARAFYPKGDVPFFGRNAASISAAATKPAIKAATPARALPERSAAAVEIAVADPVAPAVPMPTREQSAGAGVDLKNAALAGGECTAGAPGCAAVAPAAVSPTAAKAEVTTSKATASMTGTSRSSASARSRASMLRAAQARAAANAAAAAQANAERARPAGAADEEVDVGF